MPNDGQPRRWAPCEYGKSREFTEFKGEIRHSQAKKYDGPDVGCTYLCPPGGPPETTPDAYSPVACRSAMPGCAADGCRNHVHQRLRELRHAGFTDAVRRRVDFGRHDVDVGHQRSSGWLPLIPLRCETASVNNCACKTPALATSKTIKSGEAIALFLTESRGVMAHA